MCVRAHPPGSSRVEQVGACVRRGVCKPGCLGVGIDYSRGKMIGGGGRKEEDEEGLEGRRRRRRKESTEYADVVDAEKSDASALIDRRNNVLRPFSSRSIVRE